MENPKGGQDPIKNSKGSIRSALNLHSVQNKQFDLRRSHVCHRLFVDGEDVCCFKYHLRHKNHEQEQYATTMSILCLQIICVRQQAQVYRICYKYNTPIPDSNPKLNVVWQNKDGGSPKVPHSQIWDLLTSRHDSSRGVVNWISCASSGALSSRPKIPEIPGGGANGTDIFWNFNSKFWVYLAKLA